MVTLHVEHGLKPQKLHNKAVHTELRAGAEFEFYVAGRSPQPGDLRRYVAHTRSPIRDYHLFQHANTT